MSFLDDRIDRAEAFILRDLGMELLLMLPLIAGNGRGRSDSSRSTTSGCGSSTLATWPPGNGSSTPRRGGSSSLPRRAWSSAPADRRCAVHRPVRSRPPTHDEQQLRESG